jgi:hypothetical protein
MTTVETTATVSQDGTLVARVPPEITPGEHRVVLVIDDRSAQGAQKQEREPFPVDDLGPWPADLSLRREDMYDDWGR